MCTRLKALRCSPAAAPVHLVTWSLRVRVRDPFRLIVLWGCCSAGGEVTLAVAMADSFMAITSSFNPVICMTSSSIRFLKRTSRFADSDDTSADSVLTISKTDDSISGMELKSYISDSVRLRVAVLAGIATCVYLLVLLRLSTTHHSSLLPCNYLQTGLVPAGLINRTKNYGARKSRTVLFSKSELYENWFESLFSLHHFFTFSSFYCTLSPQFYIT